MNRMLRLSLILALSSAASTASAEMTDAKVKELIGQYLKENPEAIIESLQAYQLAQEAKTLEAQKASIREVLPHFNKKDLPYGEAGNPKGDLLIAEFYDYNCPACKMMFESIDQLLKEDKNARVVFVEYPIFGETSDQNARLSMAFNALAPEKFYDFHASLMRNKGKIDETLMLTIAGNMGVDKEKLKAEAAKAVYNTYIAQDRELASKLQIQGTPAVIIGEEFHGGALTSAQLKEAVSKARASKTP